MQQLTIRMQGDFKRFQLYNMLYQMNVKHSDKDVDVYQMVSMNKITQCHSGKHEIGLNSIVLQLVRSMIMII